MLIITDIGVDKFAETFLANNVGFLHRRLESLQAAPLQPSAFVQSGSILKVDRASPNYDAVIDGLKQTSVTLQSGNQLSLPEALKQRLIQELEAAKAVLSAPEVQAELVVNFVLKTLKGIAEKLAGAAVSNLALATIDAILRLFGLHHLECPSRTGPFLYG